MLLKAARSFHGVEVWEQDELGLPLHVFGAVTLR